MAVSYDQDIRPLFRSGDIACMTPKGIRLGDAEWMRDPAADQGLDDYGHARRVFAALLAGFMPPGQKWPQAWLDLYSN
ncbi:hypothetical protein [Bradyrhizobium sp. Tv2a-2]|uniref:hypothetical protein n=1 Tax=Bradyrhizobium sp. Tv2a-2 TaxID=113395 RepID=UPI0003FD2650|nr:hypothetical protein [Bradyrhizobium sp. Tv2a-2]